MNNKTRLPLIGSVFAVLLILIIALPINAKASREKTTEYEKSIIGKTFEELSEDTGTDPGDSLEPMTISDYLLDGELPVTAKDMGSYLSTEDNEDVSDEGEYSEDEAVLQETDDKEASNLPKADTSDWNLILVNKQNYIPQDYNANLVSLNGNMQVDRRIAPSLAKMLDAAKRDNVDLMICSAYRSYDRQTTLFNNKINKLMASGMSYFDAYKLGSYSVTIPGTSEHQLGLALDIVTSSHTSLNEGFSDTVAGKWLEKNAPSYGFVLRYPKGKEYITGITFEPWHFRYVGEDNAEYLTDNNLTLEEYLDLLEDSKE